MTWFYTSYNPETHISIHMPHTWHDIKHVVGQVQLHNFNPHATYVA